MKGRQAARLLGGSGVRRSYLWRAVVPVGLGLGQERSPYILHMGRLYVAY